MAGQQGAQSVGQCVVFEIGYAEQAFCGLFYVAGHDAKAGIVVEYAGSKEHGRQHQRHQVLLDLVIEDADILQVVAGFDAADGLFDAPALLYNKRNKTKERSQIPQTRRGSHRVNVLT